MAIRRRMRMNPVSRQSAVRGTSKVVVMNLRDGFRFTQGSLQDYVECPRRFQLRYVRRLRWPAVQAEPAQENERHRRQGATLHRLIHQHLMGVPAEALARTVTDSRVQRWWEEYLDSSFATVTDRCYPEIALSTRVGRFRLAARYDLVVVNGEGGALIIDWKTDRRRPARRWLKERLQTQVYPYVLMEAAGQIGTGTPLDPGRVRMIYWFANFPSEPEKFVYGRRRREVDRADLFNLVGEIEERVGACAEGEVLGRTDDARRCGFCCYRSLCERGVQPLRRRGSSADATWLEDAATETTDAGGLDLSLDFEQIAEVELG